ncbi:MAG: heterodisulfide reductase, partial [Desulfobacterales bacterium]|nr:heterodisulfide reductase [Desulfobacterales bacterium]
MDLNFFGADKTREEPEMLQYLLQPVQDMVNACIQCGTCTGSCPNAFAMDSTPRKMWRMVLSGRADDIF